MYNGRRTYPHQKEPEVQALVDLWIKGDTREIVKIIDRVNQDDQNDQLNANINIIGESIIRALGKNFEQGQPVMTSLTSIIRGTDPQRAARLIHSLPRLDLLKDAHAKQVLALVEATALHGDHINGRNVANPSAVNGMQEVRLAIAKSFLPQVEDKETEKHRDALMMLARHMVDEGHQVKQALQSHFVPAASRATNTVSDRSGWTQKLDALQTAIASQPAGPAPPTGKVVELRRFTGPG